MSEEEEIGINKEFEETDAEEQGAVPSGANVVTPEELEGVEDEMFEHHRYVVDPGQEPLRVDKYLQVHIKNISRSKMTNAAKAGAIRVNDKIVKASYKVQPGDILTVVTAEAKEDRNAKPEDIPLDIVYEDEDVMVVNKPFNMVVHPGLGNWTGTLVSGLLYHFTKLPEGSMPGRPGLVHRIDKDTTGLLVIAKTDFAMTHLAKQFFDHSVDRVYTAIVWGDFEEEEGTYEGNIGRNPRFRKIMQVFEEEDIGKHAVTHYKVLERFGYVTLVNCILETGRTHQIRVHMKHNGHPLFGDMTYGGDKIVKGTIYSKYKQFIDNCFKIIPRQALHAGSLGFEHPKTGERMTFEAPLPDDMTQVIEKWRRYMVNLNRAN